MINFQTPECGTILGSEKLTRRVVEQAIAFGFDFAGCYLLPAEEVATKFTTLEPAEASVDDSVRASLAKMTATNEALGRRVVLVQWSDGTESFVAFDVDAAVPPPQMLQRAYRAGYGARREGTWLANNTKGRGHD